ncbi:MAG: branched-chain amino acid ABC transporter permease [Sphaerochaetaceae bacterium]|nr:branched-chain amino acid ABC transporter permease [Sphaerochaetaceae bacterium]
MEKKFKIAMPVRYGINFALIVLGWVIFTVLFSTGALNDYWKGIVVNIGVNIILATSLNIACGYLGQLPLGHAGFMAVGAYTGAIYIKATPAYDLLRAGNTTAIIPYVIVAIILAALVSGIFGLLIGIPALRLKGDYLAIITLGFGEIIRIVITNIDSVLGFKFTYGASGLARIPKFSSFNLMYIMTVISLFLIHVFMKSRHGRAVLSIRDNEIAAESVGINTTFYKTTAFVFSAMLAGVAGCLYAGTLGSLYPATFKFMKSIEILVMVVLGGMGSMLGSVIAAIVLTGLPELLRSFSDYRMVLYSLALVLMMIFRPKGLMGTYDFSLNKSIENIVNKIRGKKAAKADKEVQE